MISIDNPSSDISIYSSDLLDKDVIVNRKNSRWIASDKSRTEKIINVILNNTTDLKINEEIENKNFFEEHKKYSNPMLQLYLTNKCNLRCLHCYMRCENGLESELDHNEIKKLISDFSAFGGKKVVLTGGEVTLYPFLLDLVEYSKNLSLEVVVLTNGTNWSDYLIRKISEFVDCVQISIDGYNEETNSIVRGNGNFEKALSCVDKFANTNTTTVVSMTPLYGFEAHIDDYISFGKSLVDKYREKNFYFVFADGLLQGRNVDYSLKKNMEYYEASMKVMSGVYKNYRDRSFAEIHTHPLYNCGYGKLVVDSNGDFTFCTCIKDIPIMGNIRSTSMNDIMMMSEMAINCTHIDNVEPCKTCDFRYVCGDKCRMEYFNNSNKICNTFSSPALSLKKDCNDSYKLFLLKSMIDCYERL